MKIDLMSLKDQKYINALNPVLPALCKIARTIGPEYGYYEGYLFILLK